VLLLLAQVAEAMEQHIIMTAAEAAVAASAGKMIFR
jgi:hypothetical protein